MKKIILTFFFCLTNIMSYSQPKHLSVQTQTEGVELKHPFELMDDELMKLYLVTFEAKGGSWPLYRNPPQEGNVDYVNVLSSCYVCYIDEKKDYYIGTYLGKVVYIPKNKAILNANFSKATDQDMSLIRMASAAKGYKLRFNFLRKISGTLNKKFILLSPEVEEESLMSPHQNFNFKIINNYPQKIKKVWLEVTGKDIKNHVLYSPKYNAKTFKISVGPINADEECSYSFNRVWHTTEWVIVDINSISIIFEDGTVKRIANPEDCILGSNYEYNLLEYMKFQHYTECDKFLYEEYSIKNNY